MSSILRLDLYVGIYALTYWRVAAFIWMGLVAAGLALIIARIALGKSNKWLLTANLLTLSATLYACCFINFAGLIAGYNVDHSLRDERPGRASSTSGICVSSGRRPSRRSTAVIAGRDVAADAALSVRLAGRACRRREPVIATAQENWRAWSFRDWRLMRYLDEQCR